MIRVPIFETDQSQHPFFRSPEKAGLKKNQEDRGDQQNSHDQHRECQRFGRVFTSIASSEYNQEQPETARFQHRQQFFMLHIQYSGIGPAAAVPLPRGGGDYLPITGALVSFSRTERVSRTLPSSIISSSGISNPGMISCGSSGG